MFSTAIIIFREILEIAMIVGVVLAATRGVPGRTLWIFGGFTAGCTGAGLVALFAETISSALSGMGQEFFNAFILFTASGFIGWTALWIRKNARLMTAHLKQVGTDVLEGKLPLYSLALIIGLALLREGSEIVLFIYGMSLSGQSTMSIVEGSIVGIGAGAVVGIMLYYGLLKIPTRYVLKVTSWLLFLLVAGLASQGFGYLSAAGYFSDMSRQVWDTSWLLSDDSIVGKSLKSLVGYEARPTLIQLIVYFGMLAGLLFIARRIDDDKTRSSSNIAPVVIILFGIFFAPRSALALDEIYSPHAEPGELSLEYNGSRTFDKNANKNDAQDHELVLEYGVNDFWTTETSAGFSKDPGGHVQLQDAEIENRFQFSEPGENWIDTGMLLAYDFSTPSQTADSLEVKLLLQKDFGLISTIANIGLTQDVGRYATSGGPDYVFLANSRYRLNQYFQPGLELQSDMGQSHVVGQFDQQQHYIGPAAWGTLFGNLKYQAAYLLGVTGASSQSAARILLEYEMHI